MKKIAAAVFALTLASAAQADAVKLFDAVPITFAGPIITPETQTFSEINPVLASEVGVYVVCDAPSTATIGSTLSAGVATGPIVVDNFLSMNGNDICTGIVQDGVTMCFTGFDTAMPWNDVTALQAAVAALADNSTTHYTGVAPLVVPLAAGGQLLTFDRWDAGGILSSTDLWLSTSCSIPAKVKILHKNGKTLCLGNPAVKAHLEHGDDINSIVIGCGN